jgi:hypothetical protein
MRRTTLEVILLIAFIVAEGAVLYYLEDPAARLSIGILLLAPMIWLSSRLGLADLASQSPSARIHKRRFTRLRGQVQQLLDEIRRLNWMAVDAERGFRSQDQALREMDLIEDRLKGLIQEIRSTAGQMAAEAESRVATEDVEREASAT